MSHCGDAAEKSEAVESQTGDGKVHDDAVSSLMSMLQEMVKSALDADTEETRSLAEFSPEFSGIVFALMQLGNMELMTKPKIFEMIALFYHLDSGKFLHHTKFAELVMHEKCMQYAEKIKDNITAYNRRTTKFKLDESIDQIAATVDNAGASANTTE